MDELDKRRGELFNKIKSFFSTKEPSVSSGEPIEQRKQKFLDFLKIGNRNLLAFLGLIPILILTLYIRTRNLPHLAGKYLIELDSYFFFRYANTIVEQGALPAIDYMRYSPLGYPTFQYKFFASTIAYVYKAIHAIMPNLSQMTWHIYYPPIITVISFVFFFLILKTLFGNKVALVSTAFLAVIPAYIQRTSAGFADHEAMAVLWMFVALWLFVLMWKAKDWRFAVVFGLLSGIFTAMMTMTWGGFRFLTLSIGIFFVASVLFTKVRKKHLAGYICWFVPFAIAFNYQLIGNFSLSWFRYIENGIVLLGIFAYILSLVIPKINQLKPVTEKISLGLTSILFALGIFSVIGFISGFLNVQTIIEPLLTVAESITATNRFGLTVSESQQPFFFGASGWWQGFGWFMLFAYAGSALLLYKIYENKNKSDNFIENLKINKYALLAVAAYTMLFIVFVLGRASTAVSAWFSGTYVFWVFGFLGILLISFWLLHKKGLLEEITTEKKAIYLLMFVFFMVCFLTSRSQIRLLFMFTLGAAIASGFFIVKSSQFLLKENKTKIIAIALILFAIFVFYGAAKTSVNINKYMGPMTPGQWEAAMGFLREDTPEGSVVTHWWDYGYMTQTVGERPSVTDGGNVRSWNHNSGRYFLTGKDTDSTLEYLKTHDVSYILISKDEIPKYHAFSLIGSDEDMDRYSTIGIFGLQDQREVRNGTMLAYGGSWPFDKDYQLGNLVLPSGQAQIYGFTLTIQNDKISDPKALVSYRGQQYSFDINCLYMEGIQFTFPTTSNTLTGCLVTKPYFQSETQVSNIGSAFWVSEKVWDTNFARLYLYGEELPYFEEVYNDQTPLGVFQGRIIGPIKIWKVSYPEYIQSNPEYLEPSKYG